jgi:hypothetical protein
VEPEHLRFGGGAAESTILPFWALYLLVAVVLILTLPRGKAIMPLLVAIFTIPMSQVVVLGGMHFLALRILILAGLARRARFRESSAGGKFPGGFNPLDRVVVLFSISSVIVFWIEFMGMAALIQGLGDLVDGLGGYLVVRFLIPDGAAIRTTIKAMAAVCVIQGVCMIYEYTSGVNVFGIIGGMPLAAAIRDGKIRAAGSLGALTSGPLAGVLIPMFLWLWTRGKSGMAACAGIVGALAMVITSNSSTSILALGASILGLAFWPLRKKMRMVRWALVTILVSLHLVMKAPVWALIARIDLTGSSSGYHRFILVDLTIRHFSDWWLIGCTYYGAWAFDMWDTCNQFVDTALRGGLVSLVCYIMIFTRGFGAIGNARKKVQGDRGQEWFLWCLGTALFATLAAQFGINYMAQLMMSFFPLLCCISVATFEATAPAEVKVGTPGDAHLASLPNLGAA